jgi:branched-chain amino acid transport system substrate-binding protein
VNDWLVQQMRKRAQVPDIFTPDGFVMAQMIVHALKTAGGDDADKMVTALEGYKFLAPKGIQAIRPQDHAMLQPMFRVQLVSKNGHLVPQLLGTATTYATAPPVVAMRG